MARKREALRVDLNTENGIRDLWDFLGHRWPKDTSRVTGVAVPIVVDGKALRQGSYLWKGVGGNIYHQPVTDE